MGDGIEHLQVDNKGIIWIGYFDEGVFGFSDLSKNGLIALNKNERVEYRHNHFISENPNSRGGRDIFIDDLYALNVSCGGKALLCPYAHFVVGEVKNGTYRMVLPEAPVSGAKGIARYEKYILFLGSYSNRSQITAVDMDTKQVRVCSLIDKDGTVVRPLRIAARNSQFVIATENQIQRFDASEIIDALGTWNTANSTALDEMLELQ